MDIKTASEHVSSISATQLRQALQGPLAPLIIDVRREAVDRHSIMRISGALRRDPDRVSSWASELPDGNDVVVYCAHGQEISQGVAAALGTHRRAAFLMGGIEDGWIPDGGDLDFKPSGGGSRWVTRERPKIDRLACPWLVRRFIDEHAQFLYVPAPQVLATARTHDAIPYDVPDVDFAHVGDRCSFDAFIAHYRLRDPALLRVADIVRAADTGHPEREPEAAGLLALSLGMAIRHRDDHEMLAAGMELYDALFAWACGRRRHTEQ